MSAFRIPRDCIKEINTICSAFLWSGPELNTRKAKVSWDDICKPKQEGGLGLRSLKEANDVSILKLIWRVISNEDSLWVKWSKVNLLKQESFWSIKTNTSLGSWMWKKLLKHRENAKPFCKVEVKNGALTSFWFDNWSGMGSLMDKTGPRGHIDLGIGRNKTLAEIWGRRRRRYHRVALLNDIETALNQKYQTRNQEQEDKVLWRGKGDVFKTSFSTKDTWNHIRTNSNQVAWHKGLWFRHSTPKYSFCAWLAMRNRLSTGDRMQSWNNGSVVKCMFCSTPVETRDHLFFSCSYATEVWTATARNVFQARFSTDWPTIENYISETSADRVQSFLERYTFQATIHMLWKERNARRHGEVPNTTTSLINWIDKQVRNQFAVIRITGDGRYDKGLQAWFASRN
ncbi:Reverse transcriptase zinc-binding domain [Arabidopsis thaliana x Arabidopsis arenosa]|nr:Reverse transcriptase zinc-binding domain [Arabidopsis thaliana x Arabidopsis arenosa]